MGYNVVVFVLKEIEAHKVGEMIYACAILPENLLHDIKCFRQDSVRIVKVEDSMTK